MLETRKRLTLVPLLWLAASAPVIAQTRAALSQPVIRRSGDEVLLVCRVTDMNPNYKYRIGFGTAETPLEVERELSRDGRVMTEKQGTFKQGYASNWWGVESVQSFGVTFGGGDEVSISARVNREHARTFERVFLFVAREYSADTWYLEDGIELKRSHW